ncbi:hypothetical protein REPUB_Repub07fG0159000 [Reevesia pubescens]
MGCVLRVRLASFFTGVASTSFLGLYILYKDYKVAHESIAQQVLLTPDHFPFVSYVIALNLLWNLWINFWVFGFMLICKSFI